MFRECSGNPKESTRLVPAEWIGRKEDRRKLKDMEELTAVEELLTAAHPCFRVTRGRHRG